MTPARLYHRGPFSAELFRHGGKGGWVFARIPKRFTPPITRAWARTPVHAVVDGQAWDTSIWRSRDGASVLALPKRIRGQKQHGDRVTVEFSYVKD